MQKLTLAAIAAITLFVAACGTDSTTSEAPSGSDTGTPTATMSPTPSVEIPDLPAPTAVSVEVGDTSLGSILTDGEGRTLYVFLLDDGANLGCIAECLAAWTPVMVEGDPEVADGVSPDVVGTVKREGEQQLTLGGQAAYWYTGDAQAGDTTGQGAESLWYVVAPDGTRITTVSPSP